MQIEKVLTISPVMPVLTIDSVQSAIPLAKALVRGGVRVLEVTLRTPDSLAAIRAIAADIPDAVVGAGTVLSEKDLLAARDAGAVFAVSPGATPSLLTAAKKIQFPLLPGIATASELMMGLELDYRHFKFFPAENVGGIAALKSLAAPFTQAQFCPTGGISLELAKNYLALPCVRCVGGSWLAPAAALKNSDWMQIESLAKQAVATLGGLQRQ